MSRKNKLSYEEMLEAIKEYETGEGSFASIAKKHEIATATLQEIMSKYKTFGEEGLKRKTGNKAYSKDFKERAVLEYLSGKGSQQEICNRYNIYSRRLFAGWVMHYNGHKEFRNHSDSGTETYMTKGRKTNWYERTDIVAFCIAHGKDYALTIQTYGVSYQQIYAWVRKYETKGVDGLTDRRGKNKPESEMTETEKLKAQMKILQAKNYDLEMENALIKKLKEIERGGR